MKYFEAQTLVGKIRSSGYLDARISIRWWRRGNPVKVEVRRPFEVWDMELKGSFDEALATWTFCWRMQHLAHHA